MEKTKTTCNGGKKKEFDAVKTFRQIKERISLDTWGLSYEEFMKYLKMPNKEHLK